MDDRLYVGVRGKFLAGLARAKMTYDRFGHLPGRPLGRSHPGHVDVTAAGAKSRNGPRQRDLRDRRSRLQTHQTRRIRLCRRPGRHVRHPAQPASVAGRDRPGIHQLEQENSVMGVSTQETEFTAPRFRKTPTKPVPDFDSKCWNSTRSTGAARPRCSTRRSTPDSNTKCGATKSASACSTRPASGNTNHAQHHRIGQFPPRALVHGVGKLFGDRQPRRSRRPGAEPLPQLDQFLSGNRRADFEAHAAVGPIKQSSMNVTLGLGIPYRQAEPPWSRPTSAKATDADPTS